MNFIINNITEIIAIITGIVTVASIIAKLTPTQVDDIWMARILKFIDLLAINNKPTELKTPESTK